MLLVFDVYRIVLLQYTNGILYCYCYCYCYYHLYYFFLSYGTSKNTTGTPQPMKGVCLDFGSESSVHPSVSAGPWSTRTAQSAVHSGNALPRCAPLVHREQRHAPRCSAPSGANQNGAPRGPPPEGFVPPGPERPCPGPDRRLVLLRTDHRSRPIRGIRSRTVPSTPPSVRETASRGGDWVASSPGQRWARLRHTPIRNEANHHQTGACQTVDTGPGALWATNRKATDRSPPDRITPGPRNPGGSGPGPPGRPR